MERDIFTGTHLEFGRTVRAFIEREVIPHFDEWEQAGMVDKDLYRRAGQTGMMGLRLPERYGGGGTDDFRYEAVIQEAFSGLGVLNAGQGIINHNVTLAYFAQLADDDQKARWFPAICRGECLTAIAMTEPGTGSDLAAVATRATWDGTSYRLNGSKTFISSAMLSDLVVVVCKTERTGSAHRDMTLLVVEAGMPGFSRGRNLDKVGQHAADTGELFFDDVPVPASNVLGAPGEGFAYLMRNLASERLAIAVSAIAHAQAAFAWTLDYTRQRTAFGRPIASFQNSRFALATMRTELDIGQVFVDHLMSLLSESRLSPEQAAEAKWWCTDLNRRVLDQCLQLHGGYGYMEEYPIARAWRDGRAMSIYGGTNEIMKELIGRRLLQV
mgnify:CR=1 FL=1